MLLILTAPTQPHLHRLCRFGLRAGPLLHAHHRANADCQEGEMPVHHGTLTSLSAACRSVGAALQMQMRGVSINIMAARLTCPDCVLGALAWNASQPLHRGQRAEWAHRSQLLRLRRADGRLSWQRQQLGSWCLLSWLDRALPLSRSRTASMQQKCWIWTP